MEGHTQYWVPNGARLSEEYGWLCVRDEKGWLMWSTKIAEMTDKGVFLSGVVSGLKPMPANPRQSGDEQP
jgi:hypothetical protein